MRWAFLSLQLFFHINQDVEKEIRKENIPYTLSNSSVRQRAMGETALLGNPMETSICKSIFAHIYRGHGMSQLKLCPHCGMEPEESIDINTNEM